VYILVLSFTDSNMAGVNELLTLSAKLVLFHKFIF